MASRNTAEKPARSSPAKGGVSDGPTHSYPPLPREPWQLAEQASGTAAGVATTAGWAPVGCFHLRICRYLGVAPDEEKKIRDAAELGGSLLDTDGVRALERCRGDEELTRLVSHEAAEALTRHASAHTARLPPESAAWIAAQDAIVGLAGLPGADGGVLANAMFDACVFEPVSGNGGDLEQGTIRWLLARIPERVARLVDDAQASPGDGRYEGPYGLSPSLDERFILSALFLLQGQDGVVWMNRIRRRKRGERELNSMFQAMHAGRLPMWEPEDWAPRLAALADERTEPRPDILRVFVIGTPPAASSAAQVRLAWVYADEPTDELLRTVARNVRGYRSGDAVRDVSLFAWNPPPERRGILSWILELSGPAGAREALVRAAYDERRIDDLTRGELSTVLERPAWADEDVPWEIIDVVEAGTVRVPDGRLAGGDPWWSFEGLPFEVQVPAGSYEVRVLVAVHPLRGRGNAAAEILIQPDAPVERWSLIETTGNGEGYTVEVAVGSFGAAETLCPGLGEDLPNDILGDTPMAVEVDGGEAGSLVMFSVLPQHQLCRTWIGTTSDGSVARLLTDLGLLDVDPTKSARARVRG